MTYSVNRRGFLGLAGLALGTTALAACGNKTDSTNNNSSSPDTNSAAPSDSSSAASTGASSASAAAGAGSITIWVDTNREAILKTIAQQFKADTGVDVKLVVKDFSKMHDDFITQVPTGKGPDATIIAHDGIGSLVQNGVAAPLELGDMASQFQPVTVQAFTYEGKVYGVPYSIENLALIRNTALAPSPAPATWDALVAAGQKIISDSGGKVKYPVVVGMDAAGGSSPYNLYPMQASFGAPVFNLGANGFDATKLAMGGANGENFAKWLAAQAKAKVLNTSITNDIAMGAFTKGQAPYIITGPWNLDAMKKAKINYAIEAIPSAGGKPSAPFVGVQGFVMSAKSQNAIATQKFLVSYLGSEKVQTALCNAGNRAPANLAAYKAAQSNKDVAAFGAVGSKGTPMPNIPAMSNVWTDWGNAEASILNGKASDPAKAWDQMITTLQGKIK